MIIDMHTHFVPAEMAASLRERSEPPRIEDTDRKLILHKNAERLLG